MKKIVYSLYMCLSIFSSSYGAKRYNSQTFLFPRPVYHNLAGFNGSWIEFSYLSANFKWGALQITALHQESSKNHNCQVGEYFLSKCKQQLLFAGDNTPFRELRDVRAEWFNLPADFSGVLTINPEQRQNGLVFTYYQNLCNWFSYNFFDSWYLTAQVPFVWVKNTLNLRQRDIRPGTTVTQGPKDIIEAVTQADLRFAKFYTGSRSDQGLAELRFDLGGHVLNYKNFLLTSYSGISIPTHSKTSPVFLFDPVVGINGHWSLNAGINVQIPLTYPNDAYSLVFFADIDNRYYLQTDHCRTFDLKTPRCFKNGWSRYLQVRRPNELPTTFAANILTVPVKVKPFNMVNLEAGLRGSWCSIMGELGYQLWAHADERVELKKPNCEGRRFLFESFGIAGQPRTQDGVLAPTSARFSTIKQLAPADEEFITIQPQDLNFRSAASRGTATHMLFGSLSFIPTAHSLARIGAFIEWPHNNAAFQQWGIWGSIAASF